MFASHTGQPSEVILDVGGEGRHPEAWNLNPSRVKTIGKRRGQPIPQHIFGRADDIPLADKSVDRLIVERTPLQVTALKEIARVISSTGTIVLRHARSPCGDPHAPAKRILPGRMSHRIIRLDGQVVQETEFRPSSLPSASTEVRDNELSPHRSSGLWIESDTANHGIGCRVGIAPRSQDDLSTETT